MIATFKKINSISEFSSNSSLCLPHNESFIFETFPSLFYSRFKKRPGNMQEWIEQYQKKDHAFKADLPIITWLGHATFLIQIGGLNIITDPVFGNIPLFKRLLPCGIPIDQLPPIDVVLISHNHPDHMDMKSLYVIANRHKKVHFCVGHRDARWFDPRIFSSVHEFKWSERVEIITTELQKIECVFLPAAHWSRRSVFDQNKSLWGSWLIRANGQTIFFAGDTAYNSHFSEISAQYTIDVALLPIGPVEPRELMKVSHIGPEEALQAFFDLKAKHFIPMHWGTFSFGRDIFDEPITILKNSWKLQSAFLHDKKVTYAKVGQQIVIQKQVSDQEQKNNIDVPNNIQDSTQMQL